ncbi:MAG: hypothetical protein IPH04_12270 [Saprospirales bacterium]|nr:hypothetical protein [Saprospirales bacterium]MBK6903542.1 hypothetical protein [Saprospirales bacterium]
MDLDTPFGKYRREVLVMEDGSLLLLRSFALYKGVYPASDYAAFRNFVKEVKKGDKERVVGKRE